MQNDTQTANNKLYDKYGLVKVKNPNGMFLKSIIIGLCMLMLSFTAFGLTTMIPKKEVSAYGFSVTKSSCVSAIYLNSMGNITSGSSLFGSYSGQLEIYINQTTGYDYSINFVSYSNGGANLAWCL